MDYVIKLDKYFMDWEWYGDTNTKVVFLHLLLNVNCQETKWRGITIKPGELVTSLSSIERSLGLTRQQLRTALDKLKKTNEIIVESTNAFSLIRINNYKNYLLAE